MRPVPPIEVIAAQRNYRCYYCEHLMIRHQHVDGTPIPRNAMTKDHFIPRTYGGMTTPDNIIAACSVCNGMRGEMEPQAFKNLLRKWFKRNPTLRAYWHALSRDEYRDLKFHCMHVHERQLRGLAIRDVEIAFRHWLYVIVNERRLKRA